MAIRQTVLPQLCLHFVIILSTHLLAHLNCDFHVFEYTDFHLLITILLLCCHADTTIAELIKEITDSDDFMSSLSVEQGIIFVL